MNLTRVGVSTFCRLLIGHNGLDDNSHVNRFYRQPEDARLSDPARAVAPNARANVTDRDVELAAS